MCIKLLWSGFRMKNMLSQYYDLFPDKIYSKKGNIYFFIDDTKVTINRVNNSQLNEKEKNIKIIVKYFTNQNKNISTVLKNKKDEFITKYKNNNYVLLKVNVIDKKITIDNLEENNITGDIENNISNLEEKNIDEIEEKIIEFNKEYTLIQKTVDYFIGVAENCVQLLKKSHEKGKLELKANIDDIDRYNYEELNNPLNFEYICKEKSISNYIKYNIYKGTINYEEIEKIINDEKINIGLLYCYLLYPNYYLNDVMKIIKEIKKEACLNKYIINNNIFLELMKYIYIRKKENLNGISDLYWINICL